MASIFKPPKITQEQLSSTLLEYGEIVYNTTKNEFFTGNGTSGGITLFNEKPTTTSELINDSNFVTSSDVEESLSAYQPISGMNIYALKSDIPSGGESEFPSDYVSDIDVFASDTLYESIMSHKELLYDPHTIFILKSFLMSQKSINHTDCFGKGDCKGM